LRWRARGRDHHRRSRLRRGHRNLRPTHGTAEPGLRRSRRPVLRGALRRAL